MNVTVSVSQPYHNSGPLCIGGGGGGGRKGTSLYKLIYLKECVALNGFF